MSAKPKDANFPGCMLAHSWDRAKVNPVGWVASEKLDGVRAIWNGEHLVTRGAIRIPAPAWFTEKLPPNAMLDGELWMGRGLFQRCSGAVRRERHSEDWPEITYQVFDVIRYNGEAHPKGLIERLCDAGHMLTGIKHARVVTQTLIYSVEELDSLFAKVVSEGGEGLIIRDPSAPWIPTRSNTMLKVKADDETDAKVVGYTPGEGKHVGRCGAILCRSIVPNPPRGKQAVDFACGTGLTDGDRDNPPKIGTIIRVGHSGFTDAGVPRFPRFNGVRAEQGGV